MKRRLIALGIVSPLLLAMICAVAFLLTGVAAWLFFSQVDQSKVIRIIPVAPLATLEANNSLTTVQANQPTESPVTEAATGLPAEIENQPTGAENDASLSPPELTPAEVEEALGFALPPDTVNSVTQAGVATRLVIPKLNLDAPVVLSPIADQTWQVDHLGQAVGHLEGTAWPGANSNIVLAGHVTLSAGVYGPFAGLAQLAPGDELFVYSGEQRFKYVVDGYQTVDRASIEVTYPTEIAQITLITCTNWNGDQERYEQRLVVKGHLVEG